MTQTGELIQLLPSNWPVSDFQTLFSTGTQASPDAEVGGAVTASNMTQIAEKRTRRSSCASGFGGFHNWSTHLPTWIMMLCMFVTSRISHAWKTPPTSSAICVYIVI